MKEQINILCLYWVGEFRGRDFTVRDVERLHRSVEKHIDRPFRFYCLTNYFGKDLVFDRIALKHNWPGWWSKIELHRPDLPPGRTLYLDLDNHVIRSLQPILDYRGDLVMFRTGIPESKHERLRKMGWVCRYQAATMLFDAGTPAMVQLYHRFEQRVGHWIRKYRSDQDVMGDWLPNQPTFPDDWMIKLDSCRSLARPLDNCIIVTGQTRDKLFRHTDTIPWLEKMARE